MSANDSSATAIVATPACQNLSIPESRFRRLPRAGVAFGPQPLPDSLTSRSQAGTSRNRNGPVVRLAAGTWAIDPVHSSINFWVRHLMVSKVRGTFDTFSGAITIAEQE